MTVATIRHLFVIASVSAADLALIHRCLLDDRYFPMGGWPLHFQLGLAGSLLMADLVVVGGSILLDRRVGGRPFLAGFVIAAACSIPVLQGVALLLPWDWFNPLFKETLDLASEIHRGLGIGVRYEDLWELTLYAVFGELVFIPELLIATTAGLLIRARARSVEGVALVGPEKGDRHPARLADRRI